MEQQTILQTERLSLKLSASFSLNDINLKCSKGELISIIGPNGSGKTTLLRVLAGILKASGKIKISNRETKDYLTKDYAKHVSYLPQKIHREASLKVKEVIEISRYPHSGLFSQISSNDIQAINSAVKTFEIEEFLNRNFYSLSAGEQQKVLIASTLAQETVIIMLDEAMSFLDPKYKNEIYSILKKLCDKQEKCILNVTHDLNHALLYSDKIIGLRRGEIIFSDLTDNFDKSAIEKLYQTKFSEVKHPETNRTMYLPK